MDDSELWAGFIILFKHGSLGSTNNLPKVRHLERDRTENRTQICSYRPYLCHSPQRRKLVQFSWWLFLQHKRASPELGHHREMSRSQAINIEGSLPWSPLLSSVSHSCIISHFKWQFLLRNNLLAAIKWTLPSHIHHQVNQEPGLGEEHCSSPLKHYARKKKKKYYVYSFQVIWRHFSSQSVFQNYFKIPILTYNLTSLQVTDNSCLLCNLHSWPAST